MKVVERIEAFKRFGSELRLILDKDGQHRYAGVFHDWCSMAQANNAWFSPENVEFRVQEIARQLEQTMLEKWLEKYELADDFSDLTIGVIAAGNIPLAGFDDMMHVILAGHNYVGKLSSDDKILLPRMAELLCEQDIRLKGKIVFTEEKLGEISAVIATGSNNSSRYFEYYFSKYPHVIRKNRNSVAVLDGNESDADLKNLGEDVFRYFGLGCRNVTKFFVPEGYTFDRFFEAIYPWGEALQQNRKYMNNYDYNRTIYMLNGEPLLDNNFLVIRREVGMSSPPGVLYFEEYTSLDEVKLRLRGDKEQIQCIVSNLPIDHAIIPGNAQKPSPWDYADGLDTLDFLISLRSSSHKQ